MISKPEFSIVAPVFNEEEIIEEFILRVEKVFNELNRSHELVIVNDGSVDRTSKIIEKLASLNENVKVVNLLKNSGQSAAINAGIKSSLGKYVVIMDSDLQHLPEEIPLFVEEIQKGFTMVSGKRVKRKESLLLRKIPSYFANLLLRITTKTKAYDMGGFKCIKGDIARKLEVRPGYHRFLPAVINIMGGTISEVEISAPERNKGTSKYGISRAFDVFLDILMLWFESSYKSRPLYLLGRISILIFTIASCIFIWLLYEKYYLGYPMGLRPPFFLTVLFYILSFLIFFHALTLELISRIMNKTLDSKNYMVKE